MNNVMKTSQNYLINITDIIIQVLWHHTVQGILKQNLSLHKRAPKSRGSSGRRRRGDGVWGGVSPSQADWGVWGAS